VSDAPSPELAERRRRRRRRVGLVLIVTASVSLLGLLVFEPYLRTRPGPFGVLLGVCMFSALLALLTALVDMAAVRRDAARERRRLVEEAFARKERNGSADPHAKDE